MDDSGLIALILGMQALVWIFVLVVIVAVYILHAYSHSKALRIMGYPNTWMAWVPFVSQYALAESVSYGMINVRVLNMFDVPAMLYRFYWVAGFLSGVIPFIGPILVMAIGVVFLGDIYTKMYARLFRTNEQSEQVMGLVSGFFPIVAVCKFMCIK